MATGISKNQSQGQKQLPHSSAGNNGNKGVDFYIAYDGKENEAAILHTPPAELISLWPRQRNYSKEFQNRLYYGDNLPILSSLLRDEKVKGHVRLVYIDPPFATTSVFQTRGLIDAYSDLLSGANYLEFLRKRLILLRGLLADDGSIFVHLDENMAFQVKVVMDEVFGRKNFRNWITRKKCNPKNYTRKTFGKVSDYLLFYSKTDNYVWHRPVDVWTPERSLKEYQYAEEGTGRKYKKVPIHAPGVRNGETGKPWRGMSPPPGKHWQYTPAKLDEMEARGEIYWSPTGNPRRKIYLDDSAGVPVQDIWLDFRDAHNQNIHITGYPTEKNPALLARIIEAASNPGDIVLDCFCGSGTTMAAASALGRKWIGIDNSPEAIPTVLKRFAVGTKPMGDFVNKKAEDETPKTLSLFESLEEPEKAIDRTKSKGRITDFFLISELTHSLDLSDILAKWKQDIGEIEEKPVAVKEAEAEYIQADVIKQAMICLAKADPVMKKLIATAGKCRLSKRLEGFEALAEAIIRQQLSKKAAETIMGRVLKATKGRHLNHKTLKTVTDSQLRASGVSARKVSYLRDLERKVLEGRLDFKKIAKLSDQEAIDMLTQVKGIGRWTAEMYLIFVMLRPDVFPQEDMALRNAIYELYGVKKSAFLKESDKIADKWRPYRSIACWYLWSYLNCARENKESY